MARQKGFWVRTPEQIKEMKRDELRHFLTHLTLDYNLLYQHYSEVINAIRVLKDVDEEEDGWSW